MRAPLLLALATLVGCASVPRDAGFPDVQRQAVSRGVHDVDDVEWRRGEEHPATARRIDELLATDLTEESAVAVALLASPRLQAVYEELSLAQADVVQAGLPRNPTVNASLKVRATGPTFGPELGFAQSLVDLLRIPFRKTVANAAFEAAKLRVTGEVLDVATETRTAYYAVLASMQARELRATVVDALARSYELRKRLHDAGNVTDYDLAQERAIYEQSKLDLATAETDVLVARARLDSLLGISGPRTAWRTAARLPELPKEEHELDLAHAETHAIEQSLELAVLRHDLVGAGATLGLARTFAFLPVLSLGGTIERDFEGPKSIGPSASFSVPIFDQGQARIATGEAHLRRLRELQRQVAIDVRAKARALGSSLVVARQRADCLGRVLLPLRHDVLGQALRQYNAMQIGAFQLIAARRNEIETAARWIGELETYWTTRAELERLLNGRLGSSLRDRNAIRGAASAPAEDDDEPLEGAH